MKIRITKKGLPKAQWLNSQPGVQLQMPAQPNYNWASFNQQQVPQMPLPKINTSGFMPSRFIKDEDILPEERPEPEQEPVNTEPETLGQSMIKSGMGPDPFKYDEVGRTLQQAYDSNPNVARSYDAGVGNAMYNSKFQSRKDVRKYTKWFNQKYGTNHKVPLLSDNAVKTAGAISNIFNSVASVGSVLDQARQNKEIERAYRNSLVNTGPVDYRQNRGDYEINTGMVDPYNTGAKSKGQFTGAFYMPMAEDGLTLGPLSFSDNPVRRNVYEYDLGYVPTTFTASPAAVSASPSSKRSAGANPLAEQTWADVSSQFQGVKHLGIWGDKRHQKTKSDHNSGDALDIGINSPEQGQQIAQKLIKEAGDRNVKYIIWNKQIWNPSISNEWRPYTGDNPHTSHVHVSFNRSKQDLGQISLTHNNPLNIHQGDFASKYGGRQGSKDGGGYVSIFPDMTTGINAAKDLLFGPSYSNLTISQARNKWVSGNPSISNESTPYIVKAIGVDKKVKDLSTAEREKLIKEFAKWEGRQAYNKIKDISLYGEGGSFYHDQDEVYYPTENNQVNMDPMKYKIRIIKSPVQEMAYGGQLGYGFDLGGRRVYTDMPESTFDSVNNTIGPVPREMATIEAEKGETMLSDVDGDGMLEHMKIGGKRHSEGGTPLAAKPGDFIFSDTKKMRIKNPSLLALFGKTAKSGGYTPAQLAKQYDLNKYKAILQDPNTDPIAKRTAEMMLNNYEKKLGMLSLVQEAQKGFPQGIPAVAQETLGEAMYGGYIPEAGYGGYFESYETGGEKKPKKVVKKEELADYERQGFKRVGNTNVWRKDTESKDIKDVIPGKFKPGVQGVPVTGLTTRKAVPGGRAGKSWENFIKGELQRGITIEQLAKQGHGTIGGLKAFESFYKPAVQAQTTGSSGQKDPDYCPDGYTFNPSTGKCELIKKDSEEITVEDDPNTPAVPPFTPTDGNIPYGWTQQDINNALLAMSNRAGIKKYPSVRRDINPVMPDFRNMDWRGRAAELQGTYNSQMNTLGTYQSPTSLAANASFMSGQQAENLINRAIDPIEQANVNIYNQVAGQSAGIMNQAMANAAQNTFLRSQDRAVLNQQYDNAVRQANQAMVQSINQGMTNASGIYNTNLVESPYYFYDPRTQKMKFNSDNARAAFEAAKRSAGPNESDMAAQYMALRSRLTGVPEDKKDDVAQMMMGLGKTGRTSATTYPFNPAMNRTTVQQPFNPYYNPYLNLRMGQ
jgi:hypothetical protein